LSLDQKSPKTKSASDSDIIVSLTQKQHVPNEEPSHKRVTSTGYNDLSINSVKNPPDFENTDIKPTHDENNPDPIEKYFVDEECKNETTDNQVKSPSNRFAPKPTLQNSDIRRAPYLPRQPNNTNKVRTTFQKDNNLPQGQ